jgi:hypothetical protein
VKWEEEAKRFEPKYVGSKYNEDVESNAAGGILYTDIV